jgi:endonuclease/exonuclease/phosphatase family metal-dependent hydrolase
MDLAILAGRAPPWDERKEECARLIARSGADVVALQEVSARQLAFLHERLPGYDVLTIPFELDDDLRTLVVLSTHVDQRATRAMTEVVFERARMVVARDAAAVLAGDFNFTVRSDEYSTMLADGWRDAYAAAGGEFDAQRIDHVFVRGPLAPRGATQPERSQPVSDHPAVLVWLELE